MSLGFPEEGDKCPECNGTMVLKPVKGCSCHINPPCHACVSNRLSCDKCGHEDDSQDHKEVIIVPCLSTREYRPRPLDNTKISYYSKQHTHFTMIKEGVYPEGTTREEVLKEVNGTFGGRFEYFGGGRFKFIAYTD